MWSIRTNDTKIGESGRGQLQFCSLRKANPQRSIRTVRSRNRGSRYRQPIFPMQLSYIITPEGTEYSEKQAKDRSSSESSYFAGDGNRFGNSLMWRKIRCRSTGMSRNALQQRSADMGRASRLRM